VTVEGASDIRRLRKSTKVEKAIAFGGRIADAANDHHEEVFRGHYAQGTTLRVMSGPGCPKSEEAKQLNKMFFACPVSPRG
jgi:hypothetical protein